MEKMCECTFRENYNLCRFLSIAGGEYLCSAPEDGCGFRAAAAVPEEETESPAAPFVRKERWYEQYYPDSRPAKNRE